jgi:hypothetical protein
LVLFVPTLDTFRRILVRLASSAMHQAWSSKLSCVLRVISVQDEWKLPTPTLRHLSVLIPVPQAPIVSRVFVAISPSQMISTILSLVSKVVIASVERPRLKVPRVALVVIIALQVRPNLSRPRSVSLRRSLVCLWPAIVSLVLSRPRSSWILVLSVRLATLAKTLVLCSLPFVLVASIVPSATRSLVMLAPWVAGPLVLA